MKKETLYHRFAIVSSQGFRCILTRPWPSAREEIIWKPLRGNPSRAVFRTADDHEVVGYIHKLPRQEGSIYAVTEPVTGATIAREFPLGGPNKWMPWTRQRVVALAANKIAERTLQDFLDTIVEPWIADYEMSPAAIRLPQEDPV